jgi:hypothetical protein
LALDKGVNVDASVLVIFRNKKLIDLNSGSSKKRRG